ncbi:thioredoxin family protein [Flavitalea flava]
MIGKALTNTLENTSGKMARELKLFVLAAVCLCIFKSSVTAQGIEFTHGDWATIKALAKKENKLIFVDFYTDWCAPCKVMAREIFPRQEVGDFFNKNFINLKMDAEKGEGPAIAARYNVAGYPTLLFASPEGELIYKVLGSTQPKELIDQGTIALTPRNDLKELQERYNKNELNKEEWFRYLNLVKAKGDDEETFKVFEKYLALYPEISADMYNKITSYVNAPGNPAFQYLQVHNKEFGALVGQDTVDNYVRTMLVADFRYKKFADDHAYFAAKKELNAIVPLSEKEALSLDTDHYWRLKDEVNYMKYSILMVDRYYHNDDHELSNCIGGSLGFVSERKNWLIILQWAQRALAIKDNSLNNCSMALVYDKLKDKPAALKYANTSLAVSKRDNDGYAPRIEMFKKQIEEGKY